MALGTVIVTGATGQVGRRLLSSLQGKCQAVIALVRQPTRLPVTEVIADWPNSARAREAIAQADAVVHLAGNLKPDRGDYISANIKTTEAVVSALSKTQTKRVIFLSYVGASINSPNAYRSTKAQAEAILQASGIPVTIFRCTHIIGSPSQPGPTAASLLSKNGKSVAVLGSGNQNVAPVYLDDVVSAIVAALEQGQDSIFDLAGPECLSMDDLVKLLNRSQAIKLNHIPPFIAKLLPWVVPDLPAALVDVMLADSVGNPQRAIEAFNLELTSLKQVWSNA
ncbi:SDR family oxidoreductase [Leptodesmis sichuanensis]|uniref:SDR family oxidoreductase n=1 Tax=Leptodesmis sichuanensis TaxID=2906798 RepID=UPI001F3275F3|nr:NAD-dependent epimerase/dehydratase family protein [Leptodesmis sichuanensis]UIE38342.1 NAD-dependent epimerase/dehydratase family protein [Leptodesmis sichuanensis A121]